MLPRQRLQYLNQRCKNDIDDSNLVDGKLIYYFVNKSDIIIDSSSNHGVVYCINCQNISVKDLTLRNNGYGVYLYNTSNSNIDNNTLLNNVRRIYLIYSSNNTLQNNIANSNSWGGIELDHSSNNALSNNTASSNNNGINMRYSNNNVLSDNIVSNGNSISLSHSSDNTLQGNTANLNNWNGIRLHYSSNNNTLYHNNLINNTPYNAYDTGTDNDTDSIGDDPHPIPGGESEDRYSLMQPWTGPPQKGGLTGDDTLTAADAAIALRMAVRGDGRVTSLDALMILQAAGRAR